ncbi:MAG: class I SAM-dependent methyltransferase [Deltaproteobacteria bacterium]|nr:class I SAM-dependent methyltransferase [Deltaproteobacteria bacterium]
MDILTALSPNTEYSTAKLQLVLGAWVLSTAFERKPKISTDSGHVAEADYHKQSIYSLLYSLYRSMGVVTSDRGEPYELTFNTWGYAWPAQWGEPPTTAADPQRFGKNAYTGLFAFAPVKEYVRGRAGRVHVVEMGCGTGAGAHHVCQHVLPECTYEAVDMQRAAIETCRRKFVPELGGRLVATHADCTELRAAAGSADIVAVCETHVTEQAGRVTEEDRLFFGTAHRLLKTGGFLVWGNAIPDGTWQPCFDLLESIGMRSVEVRDVTEYAILARDQDRARVDAYVSQCLEKFLAFRIPFLGPKKRVEARLAMENFYRNPGTNLYANMTTRKDSYRVVLFQKAA